MTRPLIIILFCDSDESKVKKRNGFWVTERSLSNLNAVWMMKKVVLHWICSQSRILSFVLVPKQVSGWRMTTLWLDSYGITNYSNCPWISATLTPNSVCCPIPVLPSFRFQTRIHESKRTWLEYRLRDIREDRETKGMTRNSRKWKFEGSDHFNSMRFSLSIQGLLSSCYADDAQVIFLFLMSYSM